MSLLEFFMCYLFSYYKLLMYHSFWGNIKLMIKLKHITDRIVTHKLDLLVMCTHENSLYTVRCEAVFLKTQELLDKYLEGDVR